MSAPFTIAAAAAAIRAGTLSPVALTQQCLASIRAHDGALNSFVLLTEERALADAARAEKEIAAGQYRGPLHGIPYGLKDIIDTAGSRRGVAPLSFSLDHIGPMTWTIEDCAIALQVLAGHDPLDAGSARIAAPDYVAALEGGVAGMRIGYCRDFHAEGSDLEMVAGLDAAMTVLASLGAEIVEIPLPSLRLFNACIRAISGAECFSIHEQTLRTAPELYARVTRERLTIGGYVTGSDYVQAQRLKRQLTDTVEALFGSLDVIACAAIATPAPLIADVETGPWRNSPPITAPFNITGQPALSQCCGYSSGGLPLAVQWVGVLFQEAKLLRVAQAYEKATPWRDRRPVLATVAMQ